MVGHSQEVVALHAELLQISGAVGGQRVLPKVALRPLEDAAVDVVVDGAVRGLLVLGGDANLERVVVVPAEVGADR